MAVFQTSFEIEASADRVWNVLVEFTKRNPGEKGAPERYPGGHVLLYFNQEGQLVRRVNGE